MRKYFFSFFPIFFAGIFLALTAGVFAVNQVKTTETFIIGTPYVLDPSTATSSSLTLYIGDSLTGVTSPAVKSAYFPISGVYTGSGTLTVQLDSDAATDQIFTLPNVGTTPTPFEMLYKDPTSPGKINPSSAGTYTYTLTVTSSAGITVYGLGAKAVVTHRYKPPTCGGGFAATGYLESSTFDTGVASGAAYNWLVWNGALGGAGQNVGHVKLQLATSNSSAGPWEATDYKGPGPTCDSSAYYEPAAAGTTMEIGCPAQHNNKRYFRYKITVCSANDCSTAGETTPHVDDVYINWSP